MAVATRDEWMSLAHEPSDIEHIFAVDGDDKATLERLDILPRVVVTEPRGCFRAYNLAAQQTTGDIIVPIEDDLHPESGWDVNVKHVLKDCWDQVACLAVGDAKDYLCIEWVFTRKFVEKRGMYHDDYFQYCADTELRLRARADRVLTKHAPGILFLHRPVEDASWKRKQTTYDRDRETLKRRWEAGWP